MAARTLQDSIDSLLSWQDPDEEYSPLADAGNRALARAETAAVAAPGVTNLVSPMREAKKITPEPSADVADDERADISQQAWARDFDSYRAAQDDADKRASRKRRDAGILQAGDDFASSMSWGAYKGRDVAGPMREQADAIEKAPLLRQQREGAYLDTSLKLQKDDPASWASKTARDLLAQTMPGFAERMGESWSRVPASQLQALMPQLDNYLALESKKLEQERPNPVYAQTLMTQYPRAFAGYDDNQKQAFMNQPMRDLVRYSQDLKEGRKLDLGEAALAETTRHNAAKEKLSREEMALERYKFDAKQRLRDAAEDGGLSKDQQREMAQRTAKVPDGSLALLDGVKKVRDIMNESGVREGRVTGLGPLTKHLPAWAIPKDVGDFRQAFMVALNTYMKSISGGAVTDNELVRNLEAAVGRGDWGAVDNGLAQLERATKANVRQAYAGASGPVVGLAAQTFGMDPSDFVASSPAPGPRAPAPTSATPGVTFRHKSGATKTLTDPAQIEKLRRNPDFTEVK